MRGLVLSGGGRRGAYHVGVLKKWMGEEGREYDILCGTSVGAINVAGLSQVKHGDPKEAYNRLSDIWDRVSNRKVKKFWWFWYLASLWRSSIYNSKPLLKWIREELDPQAIADSGRIVRVGAINWSEGKVFVADENNPKLADWVYNSSCYPLAFTPIKTDGEEWMDWGVKDVTPLGEAIRAGADEIDVITTFNPDLPSERWDPWYKAVPARGLRVIELMMDAIMEGDLKEAGLKNDLAQLGGKYKHVKINVQMPSKPLLANSLDFDPAKVKEERDFGYQDAG